MSEAARTTISGVGKTVVDRERYFASGLRVPGPAGVRENGGAASTEKKVEQVTETTVVNAAELSEAMAELSKLRSVAQEVQNSNVQQPSPRPLYTSYSSLQPPPPGHPTVHKYVQWV